MSRVVAGTTADRVGGTAAATPADATPVDAAAAPAGTRDRLLAACEVCLRRDGLRRTTMVDVAREAGVSRAALYKHFGDKATLVLATIAHTDERFWAEAHRRVARRRSLVAQVAEAVELSREQERAVRPGSLMQHLRRTDRDELAVVLDTGLREVLPAMAEFWRPHLERAVERGEVRADLDVGRSAEWVMRMVLSLLTVPGEAVDVDDPTSLRGFLDEFLLSGLR